MAAASPAGMGAAVPSPAADPDPGARGAGARLGACAGSDASAWLGACAGASAAAAAAAAASTPASDVHDVLRAVGHMRRAHRGIHALRRKRGVGLRDRAGLHRARGRQHGVLGAVPAVGARV